MFQAINIVMNSFNSLLSSYIFLFILYEKNKYYNNGIYKFNTYNSLHSEKLQ